MPKLIENLRERILADARQTLTDEGYRALSMRGLARRAGVAPGTLYNYFSSKDELVATIALADWRQVTSRMECAARRLGCTDVADVADVLAEALLACSVSADLGTDQLVKLASILDAARPEQEDPA